MKKIIYILSLVINSLFAHAQKSELALPQFEPGFLYFVCRVQKEKVSATISTYNLFNTPYSHVAVGLVTKGQLTLFHIEDRPGNAFTISTPEQFVNSFTAQLTVFRIPISVSEEHEIKTYLRNFKEALFDYEFSFTNNRLYCSEFCAQITETFLHLPFQPISRNITDPFISGFLGREGLSYVPIDYFLSFSRTEKVFEKIFR